MKRLAILMAVAAGCAEPPHETVYERPVDRAVEDGVEFLIGSQHEDGSWGSPQGRGFDIYAPVPGAHQAFRVAATALCVMALREVAGRKGAEARRRGVEYLLAHGDVRRQDAIAMYNVWAHIYCIQALCREHAAEKDERVQAAVRHHIDMLARYESAFGGWNYYDFAIGTQRPASKGTSFASAAAVVALDEARQRGFDVPQRQRRPPATGSDNMVSRAVRLIEKCRQPDGSFLYDLEMEYMPQHPANLEKGSVGRAQVANCALWAHSRLSGFHDVRESLARLIRERKFLDLGRKRPFPHEAYYANSGYYYYFAYYYASRLIEVLPADEQARYGQGLLAGLVPLQEPDGSWWDFPLFGYDKPYGTAFALMAIHRAYREE